MSYLLSFYTDLGSIDAEGFLVSIIIVNYNSSDLLRACLVSLLKFVTVPFEAVVVDNDSHDDSLKNLPEMGARLKIVHAGENLGFPRACNLGAKNASGQVFHFLNPDSEVTENINECYALALNEVEPCIYVTRILNTRNDSERSSHPLPTLQNIFRMFFQPSRVERWYIGASVVISRGLLERLGGWSTEYFMYMEDTDLFYKAKLAGMRTIETASLIVHHQGGISRQVWSERQRLERIERSAFIFARKFGLKFDYFAFKHLAFLKIVWREPAGALLGLYVYWREFFHQLISRSEINALK